MEKNNVILESVKLAEDGSGDLILRLYESKKAAVHTALFTTLPVAQAWSCTMLEEKTMEKQELLTEGKFFHGFFIRKISLIVVIAGKDIRDFTDRNISERINVVYDILHSDDLVSVYDKVDHRFVAV